MMVHSRIKSAWLFLPVSCLLLLTGCWSRIEINDRAYVTAMYIDRSNNGDYEVSLGFPLPNRMASAGSQTVGGASGGNPFSIVTKTAESFPIAIRKIRSDLTREISWGHCRVIVVGKKMAESGIDAILEFVSREPNFHTKNYVMVAPGKAKDISNLTPVFERLPSEVLRKFARRKITLDTSVKDFLEARSAEGDTLTTMLTIGEIKMLSENRKMSTWVGTNGAALFKNQKMAGIFDASEMKVGLWLKGDMKNFMISLKSPTDAKKISFIIISSKATIKPIVEQDNIRFHIGIEAEVDVLSSESNIDLTDRKQIERIQNMLSQQLKGKVMQTIHKTQTMGVDVFGFGRYLDWRYPKIMNEHRAHWRSTYTSSQISVDAHIQVKRTGAERNSILQQQYVK